MYNCIIIAYCVEQDLNVRYVVEHSPSTTRLKCLTAVISFLLVSIFVFLMPLLRLPFLVVVENSQNFNLGLPSIHYCLPFPLDHHRLLLFYFEFILQSFLFTSQMRDLLPRDKVRSSLAPGSLFKAEQR